MTFAWSGDAAFAWADVDGLEEGGADRMKNQLDEEKGPEGQLCGGVEVR